MWSGMICRACEDAIADALLHTRGVVSAQAHYWRGRVTITYDPNIVTEDTLRQVLTNAGYPPGTHGMGGVVVDGICLALVGVLYWGLPKLLALVKVRRSRTMPRSVSCFSSACSRARTASACAAAFCSRRRRMRAA